GDARLPRRARRELAHLRLALSREQLSHEPAAGRPGRRRCRYGRRDPGDRPQHRFPGSGRRPHGATRPGRRRPIRGRNAMKTGGVLDPRKRTLVALCVTLLAAGSMPLRADDPPKPEPENPPETTP